MSSGSILALEVVCGLVSQSGKCSSLKVVNRSLKVVSFLLANCLKYSCGKSLGKSSLGKSSLGKSSGGKSLGKWSRGKSSCLKVVNRLKVASGILLQKVRDGN